MVVVVGKRSRRRLGRRLEERERQGVSKSGAAISLGCPSIISSSSSRE